MTQNLYSLPRVVWLPVTLITNLRNLLRTFLGDA